MALTSWIARRYLFSRQIGKFGVLLTVVAVASIAIGIFSLTAVMSVMRGFKTELTDRMLGFNAHLTYRMVSDDAEPLAKNDIIALLGNEKIRDVAPFVEGEIIAKSTTTGDAIAQGAKIRGVDFANLGVMEDIEFFVPDGQVIGAKNGAIIGKGIITQLVVHPSFGDNIELIAPLADIGPTGEFVPNKKSFPVLAVFKSGIYEYDAKYVLVPQDEARKLLGTQVREGWQVRFDDASTAPAIIEALRGSLPKGWSVEGWHEQNKKLFAALKLERIAMGLILTMALLIASFSIAGVVLLITSAKRKDAAILGSMGMRASEIVKIFILNATYLGLLGTSIGLFCGVTLCLILERWPMRLPDAYYLEYLPVALDPIVVFAFAILGVSIAIVSAIYPIRQVANTNLIDLLRYE
ncbi:MAG: FtsX-like permease family protein [Deltaproteobacteria bacterium]|jgi:lipoprotein-releasing system permease protein|nr:FtsX-like permease family protein [Deltaproteobacteria bacterium]